MCGIAAFFSQSKPVLTDALAAAVQSLIHRGPDNQSVWLSKDQRVGLGHTRLSIIDLATGDQPIANEDERVRIVVNGEFYDFERQRFELKKRGHQFRTRSDSEIALHLYEDFGAHCLRHLRGEFAFVLWDESNQLLLAARDRFGIKPLYYAIRGKGALRGGSTSAMGPRVFLSTRDRPRDAGSHSLRRRSSSPTRTLSDGHTERHESTPLLGI
jgi:asparagine synthase (glutamine-hydrolysing)